MKTLANAHVSGQVTDPSKLSESSDTTRKKVSRKSESRCKTISSAVLRVEVREGTCHSGEERYAALVALGCGKKQMTSSHPRVIRRSQMPMAFPNSPKNDSDSDNHENIIFVAKRIDVEGIIYPY